MTEAEVQNIVKTFMSAVGHYPFWSVFAAIDHFKTREKWMPLPAALSERCAKERRAGVAAEDAIKIRDRLTRILNESKRRDLTPPQRSHEKKGGERYSTLSEQEKADFDSMMSSFYAKMKSSRPQTQKPKLKLKQQLPDGRWVESPTLEDIQNAKEKISGVAAE